MASIRGVRPEGLGMAGKFNGSKFVAPIAAAIGVLVTVFFFVISGEVDRSTAVDAAQYESIQHNAKRITGVELDVGCIKTMQKVIVDDGKEIKSDIKEIKKAIVN